MHKLIKFFKITSEQLSVDSIASFIGHMKIFYHSKKQRVKVPSSIGFLMTLVIPAKAGIQSEIKSRRKNKSY